MGIFVSLAKINFLGAYIYFSPSGLKATPARGGVQYLDSLSFVARKMLLSLKFEDEKMPLAHQIVVVRIRVRWFELHVFGLSKRYEQ